MPCTRKTYSDYIYILEDLATKLGLTVKHHCDYLASESVAGRIHYEQRLIELNECTAKRCLMTFAHELGHWHHHMRNNDVEACYRVEYREKCAYLYGWGILAKYCDKVISKECWREHNDKL